MLSYRHAFHAGNHADVLKHLALTRTLLALQRKPAPFCYIDTHAGAGRYDLSSEMALKVGEFRQGIARILTHSDVPASMEPWLEAVQALNQGGGLRHYPGSPAIARHFLRPQDRMLLIEKHSTDHALLLRNFGQLARCRVVQDDGWTVLKAQLPPPEKRGVVLIDPSYELKSAYRLTVEALQQAHQRWSSGIYLLWYPLLARLETERMLERIVATGIPRILRVTLAVRGADTGGLWGSGMLVINPPWQLDTEMQAILPWLAEALEVPKGTRGTGVDWLVPELSR
ncbi:MAG: 23S rRNA (adenine(2030)-N(6))-methyltransferase RlmJ [Gammaproteobacteria bacterium]|nr:23S rRNA (adenine(2030)-N(6))-methyltransferase RlmJ [Gammaproteobacteria bacterium]